MCDFVKHTKAGISPPLIQGPPAKLFLHLGNTIVREVAIHGPANSSPMDHFYFLSECLSVRTPYSGAVFKLWAHNSLMCSLTDTFMFRFEISLMKPSDLFALEVILFIRIRIRIVYWRYVQGQSFTRTCV